MEQSESNQRGEVGGDNGGKGEQDFRNNYKGHMDKTKGGWNREVGGDGWGGEGSGSGEMQTTVLEQQ